MRDRKFIDSEVAKLVLEGKTNKEIAEHLKTNPTSVANWLKRLGLTANRTYPVFSDEQKQNMIEMHKLPMDAISIAKKIGTTPHRVRKTLNDMGYDTSLIHYTDEDVNAIISDYQAGLTFNQLEEKYGLYRQCLTHILKSRNIVRRTRREVKQNTWYIREDAFKDMTSEHSLFFYGLLVTDGCIKDDGSVAIELKDTDADVVIKFAEYLHIVDRIRYVDKTGYKGDENGKRSNTVVLAFKDSVVSETLIKLGLEPRKSLNETLPNCKLSDDLAIHFWRGCLAGDGHLGMHDGRPIIHLCGGESLISEFSSFIQRVLNLKKQPKVRSTIRRSGGAELFFTTVSGSKAVDLANILYSNSTVNMQRKLDMAVKFKEYSPKYVWFRDRNKETKE